MRNKLCLLLVISLALLLTSCDFYKMIVPQPIKEHYLKGYVKDAAGNIITDASIYVVFEPIEFSKGINDSIIEISEFFYAEETEQHYLNVTWITITESNVTGFYLLKNTINDISTSHTITSLIPATNTNQPHTYSYLDTDVSIGSYYYWLKAVEADTIISYYGPVVGNVTMMPGIPNDWGIHVSPNPVSDGCTIAYDVKEDRHVKIWVNCRFDTTSVILYEGNRSAGRHSLSWNGYGQDETPVCNGLYVVHASFTIENSVIQHLESALLFVNNRQLSNKPYTKSTTEGYRIPIREYLKPGEDFQSTDLSGNQLNIYKISGSYTIYVKKPGYHTESRFISITNSSKDRIADFVLHPMVKTNK